MTYSAKGGLNWSAHSVLALLRQVEGFHDYCIICSLYPKTDGHAENCALAWHIEKFAVEAGTPSRTFEPRPAQPADLTNTRSEGPTNNGAGDSLAGARSEAAR